MASPSQTEVSVPIYAAAPLPPGWTEHRAPTGQFYYYHADSGESTYVRPSIQVVAPKEQDTQPAISANPSGGDSSEKKSSTTTKKKEKPKTKEPIPDTVWMKVTTTAGNIFYSNVETKVSSWTVPDEIKEQVKLYEEAQARKAEELKQAELEQARLKAEEAKRIHEAEQRRIIELEVQKVRAEVEAEAQLRGLKRKTQEPPPQSHPPPSSTTATSAHPNLSNSVASIPPTENDRQAKIPRLEHTTGENDQDEEWQRQIAEEMAQEAAEQSGTTLPQKAEQTRPLTIPNNPPPPAGLSLEELKATFKAMLLEKSIDPMAPWDNELPKFVTDARYLALPSMKERRDLFDEFCKEKIRQQRAAKQAAPKVDPPQAYRSLLIEFVSSTRTLWEDFKNKHKKDQRFRNFGRDDREREKVFKSWLKELGEQKRQQLMKAEEDFRTLLAEKASLVEEEGYADFKLRVQKDARFLAITSNSSKESMWKKWREESRRAAAANDKNSSTNGISELESQKTNEEKKNREMQSLKAREEQVRSMHKTLEKASKQTKTLLGREEAEREFESFLIDHVRDHNADWSDVKSQLTRDPRYEEIRCLAPHELKAIFTRHTDSIYAKHIRNLESYFDQQVQRPLTARFSDVREKLVKLTCDAEDERVENPKQPKLTEEEMKVKQTIMRLTEAGGGKGSRDGGLSKIEDAFDAWKVKREERAKSEFLDMFKESLFVNFWGSMKKAAMLKNRDDKLHKADLIQTEAGGEKSRHDGDDQEGEGEGDEGVDFKEMAKSIDIREIHTIFKNDRRWITWDHVPEQRDVWIREYLDQLSVPKQTVYQRDS
ncbi:hypothetical protein PCANC_08011 [Puccinia coronata f. sp. avenae]|uniref:WW domain-containing protein n=1 Tax=Puccinia coronata f. sp. avenae TaxID=200324 RepID=A0A2N5SWA6_9BASI|nr:hypothetical protein PCANC_08011 [Puccinia coronata f. sp. avenae]